MAHIGAEYHVSDTIMHKPLPAHAIRVAGGAAATAKAGRDRVE